MTRVLVRTVASLIVIGRTLFFFFSLFVFEQFIYIENLLLEELIVSFLASLCRTIVGDEADYCLAELSSSSNSPPGSDQACISSPEEKELPPLVRMRKPEKLRTAHQVCG